MDDRQAGLGEYCGLLRRLCINPRYPPSVYRFAGQPVKEFRWKRNQDGDTEVIVDFWDGSRFVFDHGSGNAFIGLSLSSAENTIFKLNKSPDADEIKPDVSKRAVFATRGSARLVYKELELHCLWQKFHYVYLDCRCISTSPGFIDEFLSLCFPEDGGVHIGNCFVVDDLHVAERLEQILHRRNIWHIPILFSIDSELIIRYDGDDYKSLILDIAKERWNGLTSRYLYDIMEQSKTEERDNGNDGNDLQGADGRQAVPSAEAVGSFR